MSVTHTAIYIVGRGGEVVRETALYTEPETLAVYLRGTGLRFERVDLKAGPMSSWLYMGLARAGLPVMCVEARHMQAALSAIRDKTDRNDTRGIAQMMRTGLYRQVHVKTRESQELRLVPVNRRTLRPAGLSGQRGHRPRSPPTVALIDGPGAACLIAGARSAKRFDPTTQGEARRRRMVSITNPC